MYRFLQKQNTSIEFYLEHSFLKIGSKPFLKSFVLIEFVHVSKNNEILV